MDLAFAKHSVFIQGQDSPTPQEIVIDGLSLKELQQLARLSEMRGIQLAPEDLNAKVNHLATQYACLITQQPQQAENQLEEIERILADLMKLADPLIEQHDYLQLPSVIKLAAEISWKLFQAKPAAFVACFHR